jgi:excinuclease ABC subunit C
LEQIEGIGKATIDTLLKTFKSVKNIKSKSTEELAEVIGNSKATIITNFFKTTNNSV